MASIKSALDRIEHNYPFRAFDHTLSKQRTRLNNMSLSNNLPRCLSALWRSDKYKASPTFVAPYVGATSIVAPPRASLPPRETPPAMHNEASRVLLENMYKERSTSSQASISFFFWAALLAPSVRASKSPLISHIPRKMLPSREISSQGASYSITLPLSRTRTLS